MASPSSSPTTARASGPSVLLVTLGCAKNEVDTDRMRSLLLADGFREAAGVADADAVVVNTCSFLAAATSESLEATLELAGTATAGARGLPVVMCGCVPSRYGAELAAELPEVAAFVPVAEEDGIVGVVRAALGMHPRGPADDLAARALRTVEGASAYLKISDGCDRRCAFCAIPAIRGAYASRPWDDIAAEAQALLDGGVRELVLVGQDTGVWGHDLPGAPTLAWLLRHVAELARPFGAWVRVLYLQPEGMTDELVATLRDTPGVLRYVDIPIQHCSRRVLSSMGRRGDPGSLRALFSRLRDEMPGMALRTTAMAGFPGETEDEADELLAFLREQEFDYLSVFAFSPEEGTRAAALPGQVGADERLGRAQRLQDLAEELGFAAAAAHVGEVVDVIVDGVEEGPDGPELIGHAWFQAPDSDGAIHIAEGAAAVGDVVRCRLVDAFCYELVGEIVGEG